MLVCAVHGLMTYNLDSIKSAARRQAWYTRDGDDTKTYNFFGRMSNPRRQRDEENSPRDGGELSQTMTENDLSSPIEQQRREQWNGEKSSGFGGPKKAGTFPEGPHGNMPPRRSREEAEAATSEKGEGNMGSGLSGSTNVPSEGQQEGIVDRSVGAESGARKRKSRKFHIPGIGKKDEPADDDPDVRRTDTTESKKNRPKLTIMSQVKAVFSSWINILLVAAPVGIALEYSGVNKIAVFVVNFVAIIPLAAMLSYATEELAMYVGETLGGLLNASFGNAVELIVSIIALAQKKILIVQTSLIGSMLSNLLLVMGMCFFFGGLNRQEQYFNITVAQTAASLLALAIGSLIIPTAFQIFADNDSGVTPTSRGTAVLLLVTYGCYLFFQLRTHIDMYNEPSQKSPKKPSGKKESGDALRGIATMGAGQAAIAGGSVNQQNLVHNEDDEEEEETPQLTRIGALITLAGSTVLVALCAEYMVSSINAITGSGGVSEEFVGLILLPIVGNAAEHATAVTVAIKDKMDLAIGVAVGSSLQIALLVLPLMVVIGWCGLGQPQDMTLSFDGFQVSVLFIAIILVNYLIQVSLCLEDLFRSTDCANDSCRMESPTGSRASCCRSPTSSSPSRHGFTRLTATSPARPSFSRSRPFLLRSSWSALLYARGIPATGARDCKVEILLVCMVLWCYGENWDMGIKD